MRWEGMSAAYTHKRRDPVEHELAQEVGGVLARRLPLIWYGRDRAALERVQTTGPRNAAVGGAIRPWCLAAWPLLQGRRGSADVGVGFLGRLFSLHVGRTC